MSGITPWVSRTTPVVDGEEVRARVANRMPNQNVQRTQHLKDLLDALDAAAGIYARNVALDPELKAGQVAYWDEANLRYGQGVAAVSFDETAGGFTLAKTAYPLGLVASKRNSTRGDIIMKGLIHFDDLTDVIGSSGQTVAEAGAYYMSANQPGKLTKQKPPVGIYCAYLRGDGYVHVDPAAREILESHVHYVFDLYAQPAGELAEPQPGRPYEFISTSDAIPGWLPADHPSFDGTAPAGAVFGYNLRAHPDLQLVWPPLPTSNAYVEMDGVGMEMGYWRVDNHGLWWFVNCYGKAPWPNDIRTPLSSSSSSQSSSSSSSSETTCDSGPTLEQIGFIFRDPMWRSLRLYFAKMVFKTNDALVTSLRAVAGSGITITGCGGEEASTGALQVGLDLSLAVQENETGWNAFKDVSGTSLKRGPIVEALQAGNDMEIEIVDGIQSGDDYFGKLKLTANIPGRDLAEPGIDLVAVESVREESLNGVFYLGMPQDRASSFTGRLLIPNGLLVTNPQVILWFLLLSRAAGTTPTMPVTTSKLPYTPDCTEVALADHPFAALGNMGVCTFTAAGRYVRVAAPALAVTPGDTLFFKVTRPGFGEAGDSYAADLGILRMGASIQPSS